MSGAFVELSHREALKITMGVLLPPEIAIRRMVMGGIVPIIWMAVMSEWQRD
jgi:hypothetical protein